MIISASRRTDIPSCYSDWLYNRIKDGFVFVRNPMNIHQISRISLSPDVIDGIVFWTKNPSPMIDRLSELKDYTYYFQFTITPYGKDVEPNLPQKNTDTISAFKRLSDMIGPDKVIWRYDPILINAKYTHAYHVQAFAKIADELHDYTKKVTISFIDEDYRGVKNNINNLRLLDFSNDAQIDLSKELAHIALNYGLSIDTCAEEIDLQRFGICRARCIDDRLFEQLLDCRLNIEKDKTQRLECGCITSIDIGMYNTCRNGCRYCYANYNQNVVDSNYRKHDPMSPLISGEVGTDDKIHDRVMKSCRDIQLSLK